MKVKGYLNSIFLVLIAMQALSASAQDKKIEAKVDSLLLQMTLEEKVGQMTQLSLRFFGKGFPDSQGTFRLDVERLLDGIGNHHIGSILNVPEHAFTLDQWHQIITSIQDIATQETRLKIPILYGIDAIHGANYTLGATIFPQSIAMAATWNPHLVEKEGEITAYELRASGIPWNFNPVLGLGRQPLWPRFWETYGEDPYLASVMGRSYVKALEGQDNDISARTKVAACLKHYLGYSFPLSGKDRTPAWIPERMLRELFLPPFKIGVEARAHTLMVNSSEINGIPIHSSPYYLNDILRNELKFDGLIVTDWNDIENLYRREKVASSNKEAVLMAIKAGIDMSMVPLDYSFYQDLLALVREGQIPITRIDESVRRILKVKFELGLFENPYPDKSLTKFACDEFREANLQAAREAITLLKNENHLLPLPKQTKVLVTGPTADKLSCLNGGWTITWQGNAEDLYPDDKPTILQAISSILGSANVLYTPGTRFDEIIDLQPVNELAAQADAIVVCLGEDAYCESEGNINDLTLPEAQLQLVKTALMTQKPVILILAEGRPRIIHRIADDVDAILMAYLPGMEGGRALADILFGDVNPSGKLPFTYPRYCNDLMAYDYKNSENVSHKTRYHPQFPFGFGLSYTTFEYSNLELSTDTLMAGQELDIRITVQNTGSRAGREVVQLYLSDLWASVTPANKRLKRFKKIYLLPGEKKTVQFVLNGDDLAYVGRNNKKTIEPGFFRATIGQLSRKFLLQ